MNYVHRKTQHHKDFSSSYVYLTVNAIPEKNVIFLFMEIDKLII